ncbi:MAG: hypothetical protein AAF738_06290 [Bacteroidota bacterium]
MQQTIEIGGKERPINFSFNAIAQLEKLEGKPMTKIFSQMDDLSMTTSIHIAYVGLVDGARKAKKNFKTSLETVGDWLDDLGFDGVGEIIELFTESLTDAKGGVKAEGETLNEKKP